MYINILKKLNGIDLQQYSEQATTMKSSTARIRARAHRQEILVKYNSKSKHANNENLYSYLKLQKLRTHLMYC